jgi:toxin CcdB
MIRQFDVLTNPVRAMRAEKPYVVVLQHSLFAEISTRVLAPLVIKAAVANPTRAHPNFEIEGQTLYLSPTDLFTITTRYLGDPVANLEPHRDRVIAALDLVFTGI